MRDKKNRNMIAGKIVLTVAGMFSVLISGYVMLHTMFASLNDDTASFIFGLIFTVATFACGLIALRCRNRDKTVIIDVFVPVGLTLVVFIVWFVFELVTTRYEHFLYFVIENLLVGLPLILMLYGAVLRAKGTDEINSRENI